LILLDTSGVLAALFPDQNQHPQCARILAAAEPPRILSPFVLAELDYLIQKFAGVDTEVLFLGEIARGAYELASFGAEDVEEARQLVRKYESLRIGLADASLVVLSRRYETRDVLTLDERHFRSLRAGRSAFRVLPADAF
jgi:predicted nucleic acid-binding protein